MIETEDKGTVKSASLPIFAFMRSRSPVNSRMDPGSRSPFAKMTCSDFGSEGKGTLSCRSAITCIPEACTGLAPPKRTDQWSSICSKGLDGVTPSDKVRVKVGGEGLSAACENQR